MEKKTLVIGASTNPDRYAYKAAQNLKLAGYDIKLLGLRKGSIAGEIIETEKKLWEDIHTVTLYVGPQHQKEYSGYLKELHPKRIIFNPGTENPSLEKELAAEGILVERACTLVLLATHQY